MQFSVVCLLLIVGLFLFASNVNAGTRTAMFWLCLERCQENKDDIRKEVSEIIDLGNKGLITGVSFEIYNLGANSQLIFNADLSEVHPIIKQQAPHLELYAMVSSYPYPPEFTSLISFCFWIFSISKRILNTTIKTGWDKSLSIPTHSLIKWSLKHKRKDSLDITLMFAKYFPSIYQLISWI